MRDGTRVTRALLQGELYREVRARPAAAGRAKEEVGAAAGAAAPRRRGRELARSRLEALLLLGLLDLAEGER